MDHYLEIQILKDPEFPSTTLMNALYSKLHRALVQLKGSDIGISFPHYGQDKKGLGNRLRLHSSQGRLKQLMELDWLKGMKDHTRVGNICPVPSNVQYAVFQRVQAIMNIERVRRRQMKRHNLSHEEVTKRIPKMDAKPLDLPFVSLRSHSTDQHFRLFIKQLPMSSRVSGYFNAYGLSKEATVPIF